STALPTLSLHDALPIWGSGLHRHTLVDPNTLDADGTTALTAFEPDDRGARVVYALSRHGSDRQELRVHDLASGADLTDVVHWVRSEEHTSELQSPDHLV